MAKKEHIMLVSLLLLLVVMVVAGTVAAIKEYYAGTVICGLVAGWNVFAVIRIYRSLVRKVGFMFDAIENDDFTFRFREDINAPESEWMLNRSLNRIKELVLSARMEAREREKYFERILDQIATGVVVLDERGVVFRTNKACLQLFGVVRLSHIRQLDMLSEGISGVFTEIEPEQNKVVKFYNESEEKALNLTASYAESEGRIFKVVTMTDITGEIDDAEMESWQRLSRVLTHEIMNSLAPITSLSQTLKESKDEELRDRGFDVIYSTAKGLKEFVENYRTLTRIPEPTKEHIDMERLVEKEIGLFNVPIELEKLTDNFFLMADSVLVSQVVVNLLKNAIEAAGNEGKVWVRIGRNIHGVLYVDVCNTGIEIPEEVRKNIFVPFFTTKEGGSGVGLSLSRQIMRLHGGTLTLFTRPNTVFRMQF